MESFLNNFKQLINNWMVRNTRLNVEEINNINSSIKFSQYLEVNILNVKFNKEIYIQLLDEIKNNYKNNLKDLFEVVLEDEKLKDFAFKLFKESLDYEVLLKQKTQEYASKIIKIDLNQPNEEVQKLDMKMRPQNKLNIKLQKLELKRDFYEQINYLENKHNLKCIKLTFMVEKQKDIMNLESYQQQNLTTKKFEEEEKYGLKKIFLNQMIQQTEFTLKIIDSNSGWIAIMRQQLQEQQLLELQMRFQKYQNMLINVDISKGFIEILKKLQNMVIEQQLKVIKYYNKQIPEMFEKFFKQQFKPLFKEINITDDEGLKEIFELQDIFDEDYKLKLLKNFDEDDKFNFIQRISKQNEIKELELSQVVNEPYLLTGRSSTPINHPQQIKIQKLLEQKEKRYLIDTPAVNIAKTETNTPYIIDKIDYKML